MKRVLLSSIVTTIIGLFLLSLIDGEEHGHVIDDSAANGQTV